MAQLDKNEGKVNRFNSDSMRGITSPFADAVQDVGITPQDAARWQGGTMAGRWVGEWLSACWMLFVCCDRGKIFKNF